MLFFDVAKCFHSKHFMFRLVLLPFLDRSFLFLVHYVFGSFDRLGGAFHYICPWFDASVLHTYVREPRRVEFPFEAYRVPCITAAMWIGLFQRRGRSGHDSSCAHVADGSVVSRSQPVWRSH